MIRQYAFIAVLGLLSASGGGLLYQHYYSLPDIQSAELTSQAEHHSLTNVRFDQLVLNDLNAQPRHLQDWDSPLMLVNFWAPWCAPCRREIPDLIEIQRRYEDRLQIVGLSFDSQQRVSAFNQQYNMNYPLLLVQHEAAMINRYFGNSSGALPFTALLNPQRQIIFQHHGEIIKADLEKHIKNALEPL